MNQRSPTNRFLDHLSKITSNWTSRRCGAVFTPPSPERCKVCRSRACYSRQMKDRRAKGKGPKAPKN
jgi:hypothetical protein